MDDKSSPFWTDCELPKSEMMGFGAICKKPLFGKTGGRAADTDRCWRAVYSFSKAISLQAHSLAPDNSPSNSDNFGNLG
jgi:hypothetical protein